jgi:hypothetical protein
MDRSGVKSLLSLRQRTGFRPLAKALEHMQARHTTFFRGEIGSPRPIRLDGANESFVAFMGRTGQDPFLIFFRQGGAW